MKASNAEPAFVSKGFSVGPSSRSGWPEHSKKVLAPALNAALNQSQAKLGDVSSEVLTEKRLDPPPPHVPSELQRRVLEAISVSVLIQCNK